MIIGLWSLHVHAIIYLKGKQGYPGVSSRAAIKKKYYWKQWERDTNFSCSWLAATTLMAELRCPTPCPSRPIAPRSPSPQMKQLFPVPIVWSGPQPGPSPPAKTLCPCYIFSKQSHLSRWGRMFWPNTAVQREFTVKKIGPCPFFISYIKNAPYMILSAKTYIAKAWSDRMHWTCYIYIYISFWELWDLATSGNPFGMARNLYIHARSEPTRFNGRARSTDSSVSGLVKMNQTE